jgi:hypothetical protein
VVLFTALHYGLDASQVDVDLHRVNALCCATAQVVVMTQVVAGIHVGCYDLLKVGTTQ